MKKTILLLSILMLPAIISAQGIEESFKIKKGDNGAVNSAALKAMKNNARAAKLLELAIKGPSPDLANDKGETFICHILWRYADSGEAWAGADSKEDGVKLLSAAKIMKAQGADINACKSEDFSTKSPLPYLIIKTVEEEDKAPQRFAKAKELIKLGLNINERGIGSFRTSRDKAAAGEDSPSGDCFLGNPAIPVRYATSKDYTNVSLLEYTVREINPNASDVEPLLLASVKFVVENGADRNSLEKAAKWLEATVFKKVKAYLEEQLAAKNKI